MTETTDKSIVVKPAVGASATAPATTPKKVKGIPWESILSPKNPTAADYAEALRKRGIYSYADAAARTPEVLSAIAEVNGLQLAEILNAAREHEQEENEE